MSDPAVNDDGTLEEPRDRLRKQTITRLLAYPFGADELIREIQRQAPEAGRRWQLREWHQPQPGEPRYFRPNEILHDATTGQPVDVVSLDP